MRIRRLVVTGVLLVLLPLAAGAAPVAEYAALGPVTPSGATVQLTGYPAAMLTSTATGASRSAGTSTWFGATTPPGQVFGSSNGKAYFSIPSVSGGTPSSTTITFASAAPVGWGFVTGDIDADQVTVSATRADGSPASVAELGFQGGFNACTSTPRQSTCGADTDVPTWDPGTGTLTGNPSASNTTGADGWFRPTVPLLSVTFLFTPRSGFPVFQLWLASVRDEVTAAVTGRVVDRGGDPVADAVVTLTGQGVDVSATTADDGRFTLPAVPPGTYTATLDPPAGLVVVGPESRPVTVSPDGTVSGLSFVVRRVRASAPTPSPAGGLLPSTGG